ncbi:Uncharacterised protein [Mycobacterium tuberculosis]|nr:Uncharacterised protein [Mycobacterium tuberculosis]
MSPPESTTVGSSPRAAALLKALALPSTSAT